MALTKTIRRWHRVLGIFVGVQLVLWIVSGIYFAWSDLDEIHGDPWRSEDAPVLLERDWIAPGQVDLASVGLEPPWSLLDVDVIDILGDPHYRMLVRATDDTSRVVLARTKDGSIRGPLTRDEAVALARKSFLPRADIVDVVRLTEADVGPHHEYRDRPLPAWRIRFDHETRTHVYVSENEAEVVRHRNRGWRVFDALWMLHTMDYRGRDDFNNPVLRTVSLLAFGIAFTGYLMWYRTRPRRKRRGS